VNVGYDAGVKLKFVCAETNFLYHAGFEGDYGYDFEIVIVIVGGAETP
jgi:hypothetical protein